MSSQRPPQKYHSGSQKHGAANLNGNGKHVPDAVAAESDCKRTKRHQDGAERERGRTILDSFYSYYHDFRSFITGSPARSTTTDKDNDGENLGGGEGLFASPQATSLGIMESESAATNTLPQSSPPPTKLEMAAMTEATTRDLEIPGIDDEDEIVCLGVTVINNKSSESSGLNKGKGLFSSPSIIPSTSLSIQPTGSHRSISIDAQEKEAAPAYFAEKVLKKRVASAGNGAGHHRLSTVTKKRNDQREKSRKLIMAKYLISHSDAKLSGFKGSEQGLRDVQEYLLKVKQYELQDGASSDVLPANRDRSFALLPSFSSTTPFAHTIHSGSLVKTEAKQIPSPSTRPSDDSSIWLQQLREKISIALAPRTREFEEITVPQTTLYDDMLQGDKELKKKIEGIQVEVPVAAIKPVIPSEEELFPPLTQEMIVAFKEMTRGSEDDDIVKAFAIPITKRDMRTLYGSSWLNDEIINFYGELCMARAKALPDRYANIYIFNTFFYEKLKTTGYTGVRRWSKKFDVFEKDYIIIPVHMGMHWCCAVINFKKKRFEYYDSLHGKNTKCVGLLRHYIEQESLDKKKMPYDTSDWTDYIPNTCPHQENGFDCGVFTCMFMEFTAREMEFAFRQRHMPYLRNRIAWEIKNVKLMWF